MQGGHRRPGVTFKLREGDITLFQVVIHGQVKHSSLSSIEERRAS